METKKKKKHNQKEMAEACERDRRDNAEYRKG